MVTSMKTIVLMSTSFSMLPAIVASEMMIRLLACISVNRSKDLLAALSCSVCK